MKGNKQIRSRHTRHSSVSTLHKQAVHQRLSASPSVSPPRSSTCASPFSLQTPTSRRTLGRGQANSAAGKAAQIFGKVLELGGVIGPSPRGDAPTSRRLQRRQIEAIISCEKRLEGEPALCPPPPADTRLMKMGEDVAELRGLTSRPGSLPPAEHGLRALGG